MPKSAAVCLFVTLGLVVGSGPARAQEVDLDSFPDVTDREFGIDLYQGAVLGSGRIVGMGGASVALAEGSAGTPANPAAPAVRPATSNDKWDWDWHVDWLSPELGSDFDGNGVPTTEELEVTPFVTGGLVGQYRQWALAFTIDSAQYEVGVADNAEISDITPTFLVGRLVVARSFAADRLTVGVGVRSGSFDMNATECELVGGVCPAESVLTETKLFSITGSSLEAGAIWRPDDKNLRVGATLSLPVSGRRVTNDECQDPADCGGYIVPNRVEVPWRIAAGVAYRKGPTRWNRKVAGDWRDERALLYGVDLVVTGAVEEGYGVEAFVAQKLQPSGRRPVVSVRGGVEYEWKPGRLRVRGGTYWEPGRFKSHTGETIAGRVHVTGGLDYRFYSFCFWGDRYRARLSLTADGAEKYFNGGLSVGLWH